jgi:hypothetical protein
LLDSGDGNAGHNGPRGTSMQISEPWIPSLIAAPGSLNDDLGFGKQLEQIF